MINSCAHFGFSERTPQRSPVLLERSRELLLRLTDPELELPPSREPGFDLDCPKLASALIAPIGGLGDVLGALRDNRRQARESERLENEALTEFNRVFLQTAGSLESWLRMAGHDDKADRVRPSRRRPGLIYGVKTVSS